MKQCRRCKENKKPSDFQKFSRNSDGLQPCCRQCKKEADRLCYEKNPRRNYERNRNASHRNRLWLHEYLQTKKCEWDGCSIDDSDMLVSDHLDPSENHLEVSKMVQCSYSLKTIKTEVAKCRVLCANHHQKHTIQQFGYKKWLPENSKN